jgi:hypothetical protein
MKATVYVRVDDLFLQIISNFRMEIENIHGSDMEDSNIVKYLNYNQNLISVTHGGAYKDLYLKTPV